MDKNVSGVDLDELLKAREELNKERGVETDPNLYNDYNPNREEQTEETNEITADNSYENITSNDSNDESSDVQDFLENEESQNNETVDDYKSSLNKEPEQVFEAKFENSKGESEQNLSKFGAFSAFEVKENAVDNSSSQQAEEINVSPEPAIEESLIDKNIDEKLDAIENSKELEDMLNKILDEIDEEDEEESSETGEDENKENDALENQNDETESLVGVDIEPKFESDELETDTEDLEEKSEEIADETLKEETIENVSQENPLTGFSLDDLVNLARDTAEKESQETEKLDKQEPESLQNESVYEPSVEISQSKDSNETEVITDFSKLTEILQNELKETEEAGEEKIQESIDEAEEDIEKYSKYAKIDNFKFINVLAEDEFKNADKFSYILGKNEENQLVFGNFKEHQNLAIFGKNESVVNTFLNSMILSLSLKNSYHAINFVLLDSNINSSFEVYNKSSYLYFNRIAKTNKEILDTLIEVSKEIDNRYEKIAGLGVKNIDSYNDIAVENAIMPMPHILLVFNNYTSASEATDNDKINACLYQILKFGRIAGVYVVVTAKLPIEVNQVNYNLSSRLSFKSDEDSRYTVGAKGAEELPDEDDALYYNISSNTISHIKIAELSSTELDLIIKDLED